MFSENLSFLMELTNTQASALGKACLIHPSHISRLRGGTRPLPKRPVFLRDMSAYFARHITADYQRAVLRDRLKLPAWPADEGRAAELIEQFLTGQEEPPADIAPLLANFRGAVEDSPALADGALPKTKRYYYGPEGKREAVLQFFRLILREEEPQTLLLSSDEEMGWLYEDPAFAQQWASHFQKVLSAGNRVKIIHNVGRDMNEMLEAVAKWIPMYTTGLIEPYYYSKLRDGVLRRTLFLAPNTAAVVSVSVNDGTGGMLNELITDREAIAALVREYEAFFALCRPLMLIMTLPMRQALWDAQNALLEGRGDVICMSGRPTLFTMPRWVAQSMQDRAPESDILRQWQVGAEFIDHLKGGTRYTELTGKGDGTPAPPLPCADLLGAPGLRYTEAEWQAHVERAGQLDRENKNYTRQVIEGIPGDICLMAREGCGVIMTKTDAPGAAFAFSEANMVHSFWGYLSRKGRIPL